MRVQVEPEIENYAPSTYKAVMSVLSEWRCRIELKRVRKKVKKKRRQYLKYPVLREKEVSKMDALVVFSPYATSHKAKQWSLKYKVPLLHLEKGFLPRSVLCDSGFWGESPLREKMPRILDRLSEKELRWGENYSQYLREGNISKRKQPNKHSGLARDFAFLPMQYMNDQSVLKFGNMPYPRFMKQAAAFCADNRIILAIKKHPHAYRKEVKPVNKLLSFLKKKHGRYVQIVDGSIHWFCQNCLFMIGMNTGATIDGLVNNCIISHCGQSIFEKTGTVIHDNDVPAGLQRCTSLSDKERENMRHRQALLVYYLYNRYLILEDDSHNSEYSNKDKVRRQLSKMVKT